MDVNSYEKAKQCIDAMLNLEMEALRDPPPNWPPPPGPVPYDQAQRQYFSGVTFPIRLRTLLSEVMTWTWEEQDGIMAVASSPQEPVMTRTRAIHLISGCHLERYVPHLVRLLEDPSTNATVRAVAAEAIGMMAGKGMLPLLYRLATDPWDDDTRSFPWACVRALCTMVIRFQFVDTRKYKTSNFDDSCRLFWQDVQPTEETIQAWSRGEQA